MYPLFEVPLIGGPLLIALIATFHILPSHVATGAFWFTYYVENKSYKENRPELLEFLKKFSLSILIFCFVTGSLTGIGIWYAATAISPRAITGLIHNYVWGWATEWVFFIIEIAAIYAYFYTFGKISRKAHLRVGLIYAMAAWISMVIITGILGFMMTPGPWLKTGGFFGGFFNDTYWPQLFMRTSFMFAIAGSYAAIVAGSMKSETGEEIKKLAGKWGLAGMLAGALCLGWYVLKMPAEAKAVIGSLKFVKTMLYMGGFTAIVMVLYFVLLALGKGRFVTPAVGVAMMGVLFLAISGGETAREVSRRPYLIPGYMYSNQIIARDLPAKGIKSEVEKMNREGFLTSYAFLPESVKTVNESNYLLAGEAVTKLQCVACHTIPEGGRNSLAAAYKRVAKDADEIFDHLDTLGDYKYMPPFVGTDVERRAAAAYIATLTGGKGADPSWVATGN